MPSKNKPSSESVALGPVSDAAVCNLGRLQAIGGEMEDIGMIPRGRSRQTSPTTSRCFRLSGGAAGGDASPAQETPARVEDNGFDGCQPLHGDLNGDPTKRLLLLTVSPFAVAAEAGKLEMAQLLAQAGAQDRGLPASTALPARARPPSPSLTATRPLPCPHTTSPRILPPLLAPLPHQSPQDADLCLARRFDGISGNRSRQGRLGATALRLLPQPPRHG